MLLYFCVGSDKQAFKPEEVRQAGLGHVVDDGSPVRCVHTKKGPDGKPGLLIATQAFAGTIRCDDKKQRWRKHPSGKWWVGIASDARPAPELFARRDQFAGQWVELADGQKWHIPQLVGVLDGRPGSIPRRFDLDDAGEPILSIDERYEDLAGRAWVIWQESIRQLGEIPPPTLRERLQLASDALALNYRLTSIEAVGLLQLFDTRSLRRTLRALIDADAVEEVLATAGKTAGGSTAKASSTPSGEAAASATST